MRTIAAIVALAAATVLPATATTAPSILSAKDAALEASDWRRAADLGASAADVVRTLQARGQLADMVPGESVVTIGPDNGIEVVTLEPLPPLDPADTSRPTVRTAGLAGSGFAFTAKRGSIVLYPTYANSFSPQAPLRPAGPRP